MLNLKNTFNEKQLQIFDLKNELLELQVKHNEMRLQLMNVSRYEYFILFV